MKKKIEETEKTEKPETTENPETTDETKPVEISSERLPELGAFLDLPAATAGAVGDTEKTDLPQDKNSDIWAGFDADVHLLTKAGIPSRRSDGSLRRKPGRKPSTGTDSLTSETKAQEGKTYAAKPPNTKVSKGEAEQAAAMTVDLITGTCAGVIGPDFAPIFHKLENGQIIDERAAMVLPWSLHYQKKGINAENMPTSLLIVASMIAYVGPRLHARGFFAKMGERFDKWIKR